MTMFTMAATLCAASYRSDPAVVWDAQGLTNHVWWGIKDEWVALRGTVVQNPVDWARDFLAIPTHPLFGHPQLGWIHAGFWLGMEETWAQIKVHLRHDNLKITGHSLGAAHATILTGLCMLDFPGQALTRIVFGEPNEAIGHSGLNGIVTQPTVTNYSFRNMWHGKEDPVTLVPIEPYACPTPRIERQLDIPDPGEDLVELHHMPHYLAAVTGYGDTV